MCFLVYFFPFVCSWIGQWKKKKRNAHKQKPQMSFENWDSFTFTSDKSTLYFTIIAERTGAREWTLIESQLQIVIVSTSYANNTISYAQVLHKIYIESMHTKIINERNEFLSYNTRVYNMWEINWRKNETLSKKSEFASNSPRYLIHPHNFHSIFFETYLKKNISNLRLRIIP